MRGGTQNKTDGFTVFLNNLSLAINMKAFVALCLLAVATALPMAKEDGVERFISAFRDCAEADTMLCLKEKAMKLTENLASSKDLTLVDGISFSRTGSPRSARSYEPLAEDPKAREQQVEERILDNVVDFLDNHALQLRMPKSLEDDEEEEDTLEEEGRGKKKKLKKLKKLKKIMPILGLIKIKFAALAALFLGIIAAVVFKGYILGKIAFIAAAFSFIKKLIESKSKSSGGGWSDPAPEENHGWDSGNSGGWGRSQIAHEMAYSAHAKQS